jgi:cytoskeletal protein CcmA (bactofilin family)
MALWKGTNESDREPATPVAPARSSMTSTPMSASPPPVAHAAERPAPSANPTPAPSARAAAVGESLIASGLVIQGKIEGAGHVRIAGHFNGDVHVDGNLTIDAGAKVTGGVRAKRVIVGGELEGNIDAASAVELTATGVLNGDLKAGSLTVAAGSRMRGNVEFGWEEKGSGKTGSGSTA